MKIRVVDWRGLSPENEWLATTEKKFFDRAYEIFFEKKFEKNLHIRKKFVPLQLDTVNADVAQLARAADL